MTLGAPWYLIALSLAGLCLAAIAWWMRWRSSARQSLLAPGKGRRARAVVSPLLLTVAVALAAFAAARPQFGAREQKTVQRGTDVAIVLDVSRSMAAEDATPTRLTAAQAGLASLIEESRGDRIGLVMFAGEPLLRSPLTSDPDALRSLVLEVDEELGLLPPGSDLGAAIEAGRRVLSSSDARSKAMIIVTDGEDHGPTLESSITRAVRDGIVLMTVGVGTVDGGRIPDLDAVDPATQIVTRLDEPTLQSIAERGGGRYLWAGVDGREIATLSSDLAKLRATAFDEKTTSLPIERYQVFAALALLLADIELLWSALASDRRSRRFGRLWPLAAPALFVAGICTSSAADLNDRANDAYDRGEYARAADLYRTAEADGGSRGEIAYNISNAMHQLGRRDEAIEEAKRALDQLGPDSSAEYALGSHLAADGQFASAVEAFKRALLVDPDDPDSKHNLEVVTILQTPTVVQTQAPPRGTATPGTGDDGAPGGDGNEDPIGRTAVPGESTNNSTPATGGTPSVGLPEEALTDEELRRALDDALAGIDQEFTVEEALELLRLLEEQNRRTIGDTTGDISRPGQPDY